MFNQRIKNVMERRHLLLATADTTVSAAAKRMAQKKTSAVMVVKDHQLIGIFTEQDAVVRVMACGLDAQTTPLSAVMTSAPLTIAPDRIFGQALLMMHEKGCRHIPVVQDGKPVGIVTARKALDPDMEEFVSETQRRLHLSDVH